MGVGGWGRVGKIGLKGLLWVTGALITLALISTVFLRWDLSGAGPLASPRFPLGRFVRDLPQHLPWLLAFSALTVLVFPARAFQWQRALSRPVPFKERYHLVAIGGFCNNALPGKLGDVIRALLLARARRFPFVEALGSVAVCKLMELAALMLLVAITFLGPFSRSLERFEAGVRAAVAACLGLMVLVVLLAHHSQSISRVLKGRRRLPRVQMFLINVGEGLRAARSLRGLLVLLAVSVPPVLAPAVGYGLGLEGLGIRGGVFAGAAVLGAIALGQSAIGVPAGTGIYYFVTSWAARSLGATEEQAAAYATLTHLATIISQIAVGGVSVWARKLRISDLRRKRGPAGEGLGQAAGA